LLNSLVSALAQRAPLLLALGVGIGLILPSLAELTRPLLGPSIWVLLTLAAMRIDPSRAVLTVRRPIPVLGGLVWMLLLTAILCWGLLTLTNAPSFLGLGIVTALVLMASTSPLMSAPALCQLLGLDDSYAMMVMIVGSLLVPFTAPAIALYALNLDLGIDPVAWSIDLTLFVGSAVALGVALRKGLGSDKVAAFRSPLDLAMVALLLVFAVAIMDGVALRLIEETAFVLSITALAYGSYIMLLIVGSLFGRLFGRNVGATLGFVNANRNVGLFLAVLPAGAHPDIFLYFAIWQLPMYTMPAVLKPVYRRFYQQV